MFAFCHWEPIWHPSLIINIFWKKFRSVRVQNLLYLFILSGFFFIVNFKYFFNSWCCILEYFILNCKLWDKFLISMITLKDPEVPWNILIYHEIFRSVWGIYLQVSWNILKFLKISRSHWNMLKYLKVFWNILTYLEIQKVLKMV